MKVLREWDQAIFGSGSPMALCVFRIVYGLIATLYWSMLLPFWRDWYSESGYITQSTNAVWLGTKFRIAPLNHLADDRLVLLALIVTLLASIATTVGFKTRISTALLALGTVSLHHRNTAFLSGADSLFRMEAIILAFAACGGALSFDSWLATRRGNSQPLKSVSLWPQRMFVFQLSVVYFTTLWTKWQGSYWRNGTATWFLPQLEEFHRFPFPTVVDRPPFTQIATYGTLVLELALAVLVFYRPLRKWILLGGLLLHGTIEYRFNIPLFAFTICALYILHYDGSEVSVWLQRMESRWLPRRMTREA